MTEPEQAPGIEEASDPTAGAEAGFETTEEDVSPFRKARPEERKLVQALNSACRVSRLHSLDNIVTREVLEEFATLMGAHLSKPHVELISVVAGDGRMYINGATVKLRRHGRNWLTDWLDFMSRMGIGAFLFRGSWNLDSARALLECFAQVGPQSPAERCRIVAEAAKNKILLPAEVAILDPEEAKAHAGQDEEDDLPDAERAIFLYARLVALAEASLVSVRIGRSPDFHVRHLRSTMMKIIESLRVGIFELRLLALTGLPPPAHEPLASHAANVAVLSIAMARLMGLTRGHLIDLGFTGFYHDLGRAIVGRQADPNGGGEHPASTDAHVMAGVGFALRGKGYGDAGLLRLAVLQEHHRVAEAYPAAAGLRRPHLFSRIVAVADAFDRLQSGTPWAPPLGPAAALTALEAEDDHDSVFTGLLRDVLGRFPRGSVLRLRQGGVGVVIDGASRRRNRAVVRRLFQEDGTPDHRRTLIEIRNVDGVQVLSPQEYRIDWPRVLLS